jgi:hypothetical protein
VKNPVETQREHTIIENQRAIDLRNYECDITTIASQANSVGPGVSLWNRIGTASARKVPSTTVTSHELRSRAKGTGTGNGNGWEETLVPDSLYGIPKNAVTGNTPEARRLLERATVSRAARLGNLNGPTLMLFTKSGAEYTPLLRDGIRANWPRGEAYKLDRSDLYTVARDETGKPKYVPFTKPICRKGMSCGIFDKCFKYGGKRTRRNLKKSKRTLKRKIKRPL